MIITFALINYDVESEEPIIEQLNAVNSVKKIQHVYDSYDILAKIESDENKTINEIIYWNIKKINAIHSVL